MIPGKFLEELAKSGTGSEKVLAREILILRNQIKGNLARIEFLRARCEKLQDDLRKERENR